MAAPLSDARRPRRWFARRTVKWRWRESNPRPRATPWVFYGRSLRLGFARRLPQAEDRRASPASMSLEGRGALPAR
jgi:hypothetical protein